MPSLCKTPQLNALTLVRLRFRDLIDHIFENQPQEVELKASKIRKQGLRLIEKGGKIMPFNRERDRHKEPAF